MECESFESRVLKELGELKDGQKAQTEILNKSNIVQAKQQKDIEHLQESRKTFLGVIGALTVTVFGLIANALATLLSAKASH